MFESKMNFRVRYCETDQMGVVHHGNYAQYFEMGRIEWLRNFKLSYKKMEEDGIGLPVVNLQTNFLKPLYYDDELTLITELKEHPTAKIIFTYKLYRNEELMSTGETTLVFVDMDRNRPIKAPSYFLELLDSY
ncbi:acyl-CoA thioesterase [Flavobacteriaceae bacterium]|nr:acyl-CoA thioesterase [Flavobacteriaceae bacterium]